jgi:cytoskeletal protein RodZ
VSYSCTCSCFYWRYLLSETNNSPGRGGGNKAWPLFVGLPIIVALAVAAVILIGGGAGQNEQSDVSDSAGQSPQKPTAEEAEQPTPTEQSPESEEQASEGGDQASEDPGGGEVLDSPALGDEGAPVVMVEYSDYQ